jgi:hypothetical protein
VLKHYICSIFFFLQIFMQEKCYVSVSFSNLPLNLYEFHIFNGKFVNLFYVSIQEMSDRKMETKIFS